MAPNITLDLNIDDDYICTFTFIQGSTFNPPDVQVMITLYQILSRIASKVDKSGSSI